MRMVRCADCGQLFYQDEGHDCRDDFEWSEPDPNPKGTRGDQECHRKREEP